MKRKKLPFLGKLVICCWNQPNDTKENKAKIKILKRTKHTFPWRLNICGNRTLEQRGRRQSCDDEHALLQLHSWNVCDTLSLPTW